MTCSTTATASKSWTGRFREEALDTRRLIVAILSGYGRDLMKVQGPQVDCEVLHFPTSTTGSQRACSTPLSAGIASAPAPGGPATAFHQP